MSGGYFPAVKGRRQAQLESDRSRWTTVRSVSWSNPSSLARPEVSAKKTSGLQGTSKNVIHGHLGPGAERQGPAGRPWSWHRRWWWLRACTGGISASPSCLFVCSFEAGRPPPPSQRHGLSLSPRTLADRASLPPSRHSETGPSLAFPRWPGGRLSTERTRSVLRRALEAFVYPSMEPTFR